MIQTAGSVMDEANATGVDTLNKKQLLKGIFVLLGDIRDRLQGAALFGDGEPAPALGMPGSTYVNTETNGFYWKGTNGWNPQQ